MTLKPRHNADLILLAAGAVLLGLLVVLVPVEAVKVVLAIPLALLIPGYAIALAVFGRAPLELAQRALLASAMSLIALILGGLILNELPGGLNKGNWVGLTIAITLIASGVAWRRREHAAGAAVRPVLWRIPKVRPASAVVVILAIAIAIGAVVASRVPLAAKLANGYESLSLTPATGDRTVRLVLSSVRQHEASYRLNVQIGTRVVLRRTVRNVKPGGELKFTLALGTSATARQIRASAVLTPGNWTPRVVRIQLPASS